MFSGLLSFIKSRTFLKHLLIFLVSLFLVSWAILASLKSYTSHGESIPVPDFKGVKLGDLGSFAEGKGVRFEVIDSLYDTKSPPGTVMRQEPEAGERVKENRTIYLYVTSILPPSLQMPKLVDRSLRQASAMITTFGLKLGKTRFVPDQCANCVLEQLHKGKKIAPGTTILKGSVIDLVIGKGLSEEEVEVPCLNGLTRREAQARLAEFGLSLGAVAFDVPKDSASSRAYRQVPSCGGEAKINLGSAVDVYFTNDPNKAGAPSENEEEEEF